MIEWRDIPGLEGRYQASADGRIRFTKELTPIKQSTGYTSVNVCFTDGTRKTMSIHRLVAAAWVENPENLPQTNHKDGVKSNNAASNLEWCTQSDNMKHAWRTGLERHTPAMAASLTKAVRASAKANRKISETQVREAKDRVARGEMQKDIALEMGVSRATLCKNLKECYEH